VGDHWEPKDSRGPSDPRAKRGKEEARKGTGATFGGVDYEGSTKQEMYERAKSLNIEGRSKMNKQELASAISWKQ
jgi:hypothetical protein